MAEAHYRIGTVARLSGLSTHVIRIWERRYAVLSPNRTAGGARLYDDADVERLRYLKLAVDVGHPIGTLAQLSTRELKRLTAVPGPGASAISETGRFVDEIVRAASYFDEPRAERALASAARALSPRSLVVEVLGPALKRIGDEWASGKLCVASEHLGSMLIRHRLGTLLSEHQPISGDGPVLAATPSGELHELGALLAAVISALHGQRVLYLGPNLPPSQIAQAARGSGARIVLLSIVALDKRAAVREVKALMRELPDGVELLLGGASAAVVASTFTPALEVVENLSQLDAWFVERARRSRRST
jgi:DNA-binding transcriptional MerR regulator/methylmalonyl-CoA mutase cobalamin-binding subunit